MQLLSITDYIGGIGSILYKFIDATGTSTGEILFWCIRCTAISHSANFWNRESASRLKAGNPKIIARGTRVVSWSIASVDWELGCTVYCFRGRDFGFLLSSTSMVFPRIANHLIIPFAPKSLRASDPQADTRRVLFNQRWTFSLEHNIWSIGSATLLHRIYIVDRRTTR
jgi:hypothetical protein